MTEYVNFGGLTQSRPVQPNTIDLIEQLKPQIFESYKQQNITALQPVDMFKPISEKTQVISGIRYIVKIQISESNFIHVTFTKQPMNNLSLEKVELHKTAIDQL